LRDDHVDAGLRSLACLSHRRHLLHEDAARGMRTVDEIAGRPERERYDGRALGERRFEHFLVERPPCHVHRKGAAVGELPDATHLGSYLLGGPQRRRDAAETAGLRDGGNELGPDFPWTAQRPLNDRVLDAERVAECRLQQSRGLLAGDCQMHS
jgi:hypothetical protein